MCGEYKPPVVSTLPFCSSQETPVEAVARVAQVNSMFVYMQVVQVRRVSTILYFAYYFQCNSFMDGTRKENPILTISLTTEV